MDLKVILSNRQEIALFSALDFESVFGVRYLSQIEYGSARTQKVLENKYRKAQRKGWITARQKWLGHYYKQMPPPLLTISWINAQVGYGVFAREKIAARRWIGAYTGILRKRRFFKRWDNLYCFDYTIGESRSTSYVIDAQNAGNYTRFINHSFDPNVGLVSIDNGQKIHVILYALKQILPGDQLLYDYGEEYWSKRKPPLLLSTKEQNKE